MTRNNVWNQDAAVIVARGEDVVRVVRPGIERDLPRRNTSSLQISLRTHGSACSSTPGASGTKIRCPGRHILAQQLQEEDDSALFLEPELVD